MLDAADDKLNPFKSKKIPMDDVKRLMMRFPVVPLYADAHVTLLRGLYDAPNYDRRTMDAQFAPDKAAEKGSKKAAFEATRDEHSLWAQFADVCSDYDEFTIRFVSLVNKVRARTHHDVGGGAAAADADGVDEEEIRRQKEEEELSLARASFDTVLTGFQLLSGWKVSDGGGPVIHGRPTACASSRISSCVRSHPPGSVRFAGSDS